MSQPDLSTLQARAYDLHNQFSWDRNSAQREHLNGCEMSLTENLIKLRRAQLSPIETAGAAVKPITPILVESLDCLLLIGQEIGADLGQAMSLHSDAHQQPLLVSMTANLHRIKTVFWDGKQSWTNAGSMLTEAARETLKEPVIAMTWRMQSELQSRGVDIEAALEAHWTGWYDLNHPTRAAHKKSPAPKPSPRP